MMEKCDCPAAVVCLYSNTHHCDCPGSNLTLCWLTLCCNDHHCDISFLQKKKSVDELHLTVV